jgi:uncharacterized circularly permuted ATP-grasp superfamily protein
MSMLANYETEEFFDEMFLGTGEARNDYGFLRNSIEALGKKELRRRSNSAEKALISMGITFTVYGDEEAEERIMPFDVIPRIMNKKEWESLEAGLKQRITAINLFLRDIYSDQKIIKDGIIPRDIIESSTGYLKECIGVRPAKDVHIHITGTDLVRDGKGTVFVLEDNLRCPSGVSYVLENREIMKRTFPELFEKLSIRPIYDYPFRLRNTLEYLTDSQPASCSGMDTRSLQFRLL